MALSRGLGRALMHARKYGLERDRECVIEASLRNQAYDPQCEAGRAEWMLEFLDEQLGAEYLKRMDCPDRFWDADQQARLAYLLARRGQSGAREALYAAFTPHPGASDLVGGREILQLDGAQGLRELLRRLRASHYNRLGSLAGALQDHYDELYGEGSAEPIIGEELLDWTPDENRAVQSLDNLFLKLSPAERKLPDYQQTWSSIATGAKCGYSLGYLGRLASAELAEAVFARLPELSDTPQLARGLEFFAQRGLPRLDDWIFRLIDHSSRRVRRWTCCALSQHQHPKVREAALRCLKRKRWRSRELSLLNLNFEPGDGVRLHPILGGDSHELIYDLCRLCEANRCSELLEVMLFVYEASPCINCRHGVIKVMQELNIFPEWAAEEHRYDALTHSAWN